MDEGAKLPGGPRPPASATIRETVAKPSMKKAVWTFISPLFLFDLVLYGKKILVEWVVQWLIYSSDRLDIESLVADSPYNDNSDRSASLQVHEGVEDIKFPHTRRLTNIAVE